MSIETEKTLSYLFARFPNLKDILKTFEYCSRDTQNNRTLVNSQIVSIDFDRLSKWFHTNPNASADSFSCSDKYIYLIEFKTGDQTVSGYKLNRLIGGVTGKINGSEKTFYEDIFPNVFLPEEGKPKLRFYLVVDTNMMGIGPLVRTLAALSLTSSSSDKSKVLFEKVLPDLKANASNPDHYDVIDIWYSDLFDTYLIKHGITSITPPA